MLFSSGANIKFSKGFINDKFLGVFFTTVDLTNTLNHFHTKCSLLLKGVKNTRDLYCLFFFFFVIRVAMLNKEFT